MKEEPLPIFQEHGPPLKGISFNFIIDTGLDITHIILQREVQAQTRTNITSSQRHNPIDIQTSMHKHTQGISKEIREWVHFRTVRYLFPPFFYYCLFYH